MDVIVVIETPSLRVEPGNETSTAVRVRNSGEIVDEFIIEAVGEPAGWTSIEPASVSLFPGAEATVQVRFAPARTPASRAGRMAFGVKASSSIDPSRSAVEEGMVEILPYRDESLSLVPGTSRGWRGATHELTVTNGGNAPITAKTSATDPDRLLTIDIQPPAMSIEPAGSRMSHILLSPKEAPLVGGSTRIPFSVSVDTGSGTPLVMDGAFERRSPLPPWLVAAAAGLLGLIVIGVVLVVGIGPGGATPSPKAASSTPGDSTPEPSDLESPSPTETAAPTATPEPVVVGNYRCLSLGEATAQVLSSGLVVGTVFPEPPGYTAADDSTVIDQTPAAGTTEPAGSDVNLIVYDPASLAECTP
jgi:hypothetical protein